jgi:glycerol-3-phosphate acyltransferase PlsY
MGVIGARLTGATDPRTVGSGRTGGTNALRARGLPRAVLVAVLDLGKGFLPILLLTAFGAPPIVAALTGLGAVLGAWKSVFLRFHGGRGVATGVGGMAAVSIWVVLIGLPVFIGTIAITRYVSLGSLLGTLAGTIASGVFVALGWLDPAWMAYTVGGTGIVWLAHRDNIGRLLAGTERKVGRSATPPAG